MDVIMGSSWTNIHITGSSWYLYMKLMMNQYLCHQQDQDPLSRRKATRNSGTQTEWDQMSLFLTHHGRVLHHEHCHYIDGNRARRREVHLCQICFHRWVVEDFTTPRFLAQSRKVACLAVACSLDVIGLITEGVVEASNLQVTVLSGRLDHLLYY